MPPRRTLPLTRPPIRAHLLRCLVGASLRRGRATSQSSHSSAPRIWTLLGARTKRRFASRSGFKQRPGFLLHDERRFASRSGLEATARGVAPRQASLRSRSGLEATARVFAPRRASLRFAKRSGSSRPDFCSRQASLCFAKRIVWPRTFARFARGGGVVRSRSGVRQSRRYVRSVRLWMIRSGRTWQSGGRPEA